MVQRKSFYLSWVELLVGGMAMAAILILYSERLAQSQQLIELENSIAPTATKHGCLTEEEYNRLQPESPKQE